MWYDVTPSNETPSCLLLEYATYFTSRTPQVKEIVQDLNDDTSTATKYHLESCHAERTLARALS